MNIRAVTDILNSKDEKATAIKEILDLFLPEFKNLDKDTPILLDLPQGLSPSVIGTGVSVLTDLYFELEITKKECTIEDLKRFVRISKILKDEDFKVVSHFKIKPEMVNKFSQVTPELFMLGVILEINRRSGILDYSLLKVSEAYYRQCMSIVELLLKNIDINESVIPNPIFGCEEYMIKGDGDFILNKNLFDIKTSKSIAVDKNSRRQLLFYYFLNHRNDLDNSFRLEYSISKLYIYKARHGKCIEIPFNLRGVSPINVINTISDIETEKISPKDGIKTIKSMLKTESNAKLSDLKSIKQSKKKKIREKKQKQYVFKLKKSFLCNETLEVFDSVIEANKKYGFSKNAIYNNLNNKWKATTTKDGDKLTWRVIYKIV